MLSIPESHCDLVDGIPYAALTTLMPDGQPQTTPIWFNHDGEHVLINTMRGFRKEKNMCHNPQVTLLLYDPANPQHNLELRGLVVEMTEEGALAHLDQLTCRYLGKTDGHFFGDSIPAELAGKYQPVKIKIALTRIRVEG